MQLPLTRAVYVADRVISERAAGIWRAEVRRLTFLHKVSEGLAVLAVDTMDHADLDGIATARTRDVRTHATVFITKGRRARFSQTVKHTLDPRAIRSIPAFFLF